LCALIVMRSASAHSVATSTHMNALTASVCSSARGSGAAYNRSHVADRLHDAALVVGEHHGHDRHRVIERPLERVEIDDAAGVDADDSGR
jgi:hypothetical protein